MKVVYKKSVKEKIDKAIKESEEQGKEIACIILTDVEYFKFLKEIGSSNWGVHVSNFFYDGVLIKKDKSERKIVSEDGGLTYRVNIDNDCMYRGIGR